MSDGTRFICDGHGNGTNHLTDEDVRYTILGGELFSFCHECAKKAHRQWATQGMTFPTWGELTVKTVAVRQLQTTPDKPDDWKPVSDKQALHIIARQKEIEWHSTRLRDLGAHNGETGTKVRMVKR